MRVAVIGLGVLGASTARSLALEGAEVTVFERAAALAGTSGTSFAWTNSHRKNPLPYHELNVAGMREHDALAANPGPVPPWLARTGNLEWAEGEAGARRLTAAVAELRDRDYPVEWLTADRARDLVPDLRVPAGLDRIAYYPTEGHVLPALLVARLWGEARENGARLRCPDTVTGLSEQDGQVHVATDQGIVPFDAVVIATGRWTEELTSATGHRIPMAAPDEAGSASVGFLGCTNPLPTRLNRVLTTPKLNVRPDGGGRLVVQGLDLDAAADPADPPRLDGPHADELRDRLTGLLSGAGEARMESLRVGQRAMPADGLTVAGFLGNSRRTYVLATHSGITLGPLLGRLAAREVRTGNSTKQLAGFRPDRIGDRAELPDLEAPRFAGEQ